MEPHKPHPSTMTTPTSVKSECIYVYSRVVAVEAEVVVEGRGLLWSNNIIIEQQRANSHTI